MAKASGRQEQTGRDLVFRQWFEDNIVPAGNGGALEESAIRKAYQRDVAPGIRLGPQGVHRMLNELGVRRSVRVGKPMRLNVGFKPVVKAVETVAADGVTSADAARAIGRGRLARDTARGEEADDVERDRLNLIRIMAWEGAEEYPTVQAVFDVFRERRRQVEEEGFGAAHDDASDPGAHEKAAACYALAAAQPDRLAPYLDPNTRRERDVRSLGWFVRDIIVWMWPWAMPWWKPKTDEPGWKRRCLVRAGALILAAIERHDREKARTSLEAQQQPQMTGV